MFLELWGHATADNVAAAMYVKEKFPNTKGYTGINQNYAWGQDLRDFDLTMQQIMSSAKASANTRRYLRVNMDQRFLPWHWIRPILFTPASGVVIWRPLSSRVTPVDFLKKNWKFFTVGERLHIEVGKKLPNGLVLGARGPYGILVKDRDSALNKWFVNTYKTCKGTPYCGSGLPIWTSYSCC